MFSSCYQQLQKYLNVCMHHALNALRKQFYSCITLLGFITSYVRHCFLDRIRLLMRKCLEHTCINWLFTHQGNMFTPFHQYRKSRKNFSTDKTNSFIMHKSKTRKCDTISVIENTGKICCRQTCESV